MKKIHLALPEYHSEIWMDKSFCGIPFAESEKEFITEDLKKVTCKKCKKSDYYKMWEEMIKMKEGT